MKDDISKAAAAMGRKGGSAKSEAKTSAARSNGAKGGRKAAFYVVRPNHFGGWVTESPRGFATQHTTKKAAEAFAHRRSEKIEYRTI